MDDLTVPEVCIVRPMPGLIKDLITTFQPLQRPQSSAGLYLSIPLRDDPGFN